MPERHSWSPRRSVLAPFLIFDIIAVAVTLSVLAAAAVGIGRASIESDIKAQMESVAAIKEQQIRDWIDHLSHATAWVAGNPEVRSGTAILTRPDAALGQTQIAYRSLVEELDRLTELGDINHAALLDLSGAIVASTDQSWEGRNRGNQDYFIQGKTALTVSEIFPSELLDQPAIVIAAPVRDTSGATVAVLSTYADLTALNEIMIQRAGLEETGETFLTNSERLLITQLTNQPGTIFQTEITGEGITRAVNGENGVTLFTDYRGEPVIGAYRWIPEYRLALVAKTDQSVAFAPIGNLRTVVVATAGGLFALLLAAGWWTVRRTTASIRDLAGYAAHIESGNLAATLEVRGDNEVSRVSRSIKTMVGRLIETQEELADLYNAAPCGYHSLDAGGVFTRINDTELKWLGYRREELVGARRFSDLLTPASVEVFESNFPVFKERGEIRDLEFDMVRKDGTVLPVLLSATAVKDAGGRYLHSRSTVIDFTDRKLARAELEKLNQSLVAANAELEAFSYSVSHDLRAPLRSIDGFSHALLEDYDGVIDGTGKDYLCRVRAATQRMGHLIDDLLNLSRVTRSDYKPEVVDLSTMAYDTMQELNAAEPERRVAFSIAPEITASGDKHLLQVLLRNLLDNAWKFTSKTPDARIEFGQSFISGEKVIFVRDNGAGFDMKYADKLFSPFQRLHSVADYAGTGIGLAIARRVVSRHGGRIWAEAASGEGAAFYFTLGTEKGGPENGKPVYAAVG